MARCGPARGVHSKTRVSSKWKSTDIPIPDQDAAGKVGPEHRLHRTGCYWIRTAENEGYINLTIEVASIRGHIPF